MAKTQVLFDEVVPVPPAILYSNPFSIDENTRKLGLVFEYTKGWEDGINVYFVWQDTPDADWRIGGDSVAPGANAWGAWERQFVVSTNALIPIPENLLCQGMYRIAVESLGIKFFDGTIRAYIVEGRRY